MIKKVNAIPKLNKHKSQARLVRDDINEAWNKGIDKFEIYGKEYKLDTLPSNVRTVVAQLTKDIICKEVEKKGYLIVPDMKRLYAKIFYVYNIKETDGSRHIYVEIRKDNINKIVDYEIEKYKSAHPDCYRSADEIPPYVATVINPNL